MAVDAPAMVAVIGAGPVGLEAALYARFLGYDVLVFERGTVGEHILRWGHVRFFSPFGGNVSPLALAALEAQGLLEGLPGRDELLTGREYVERYLRPLAASDLLEGCVQERTEVLAVGKTGPLKGELIQDEERGDYDFRLLIRMPDGTEKSVLADVVIDVSGTFSQPNSLGEGGIPAVGEAAAAARIFRSVPDVLGEDRDHFAGRRTLLVGHGHSAATAAVALAELQAVAPRTQVYWSTLSPLSRPLPEIAEDPIAARGALAKAANDLASGKRAGIERHPETAVQKIEMPSPTGPFKVTLDGPEPVELEVDEIVAAVGFRPDWSIVRELQVATCYATEGLLKLSASLLALPTTGDCLKTPPSELKNLIQPEPNFYVLGAKSFGRNTSFLLAAGLDQIRLIFGLIGDREDLDLYRTMGKSLPK